MKAEKKLEKASQLMAILLPYIDGAIESNKNSHAVPLLQTLHFKLTNILNVMVNGEELEKGNG